MLGFSSLVSMSMPFKGDYVKSSSPIRAGAAVRQFGGAATVLGFANIRLFSAQNFT